jgi:hypothetical protein
MTTPRIRAGAIGAGLLSSLALALPAAAATPEQGKLTRFEPSITWAGESTGSLVQYAHFFRGAQVVDECVAPLCDSFTLTVEDAGFLEIGAEDASGYTEMQVKDAEGNELFWSEGEDGVPTVFATDAEPGTYTVEVLTDALAPEVDDSSYTAYAKLNDGIAEPRPATEPAPE